MRTMRKLAMLVTGIAAVLALSGTTVSATPVEVTDPQQQQHCPMLMFDDDTVSGGCQIHVMANDVEWGYVLGGIPSTLGTCDLEATLLMDENGEIAIDDVSFANCEELPIVQCTGELAHQASPNNGDDPWAGVSGSTEETAPDEVSLEIGVCYSVPSVSFDCEGIATLTIDTAQGANPMSTHSEGLEGGSGPCFLEGTLSLETLEITHL